MTRTSPLVLAALLLAGCNSAPTVSEVTLVSAAVPAPPAAPNDGDARAAAVDLIASMDDAQRAATVLAVDHDAHDDWHYVPRRRRGLSIGDMTEAQRHGLHRLLQHALSDVGYLKAMEIVWLESVLQELENGSPGRDPGRYTLLLFGDPAAADAAWGWRFEGHHLSLNFTYTDRGVVTTPMFMGASPAVVPHGLHAGKRILADEHNLAFAFIASLTDAQRQAMMLDQRPGDVITGPGRERALREPAGIEYRDLSEPQQAALVDLMMVYADRLTRDDTERFVWPALISRGIHFAWAGSTNPGAPHYYRIFAQDQFVIEYNCQGSVSHVHSVFHDLTDPLAEDLLRRHFEQHHAGE
jgi:hypothetical protein